MERIERLDDRTTSYIVEACIERSIRDLEAETLERHGIVTRSVYPTLSEEKLDELVAGEPHQAVATHDKTGTGSTKPPNPSPTKRTKRSVNGQK